ncbi:hypothetical protein AB0A63_10640 [Lentzea sp. NPDC042327]|uniref:hypothetical protein n=1 Tax=Lentzea sp. NPDC042327 TaxID=3154801 RepID=UPI0033C43B46
MLDRFRVRNGEHALPVTGLEQVQHPREHRGEVHEPVCDVAGIRALARQVLAGLSDDDLDDVLQVIAELVSDAFDCGRSARWMRLFVTPAP